MNRRRTDLANSLRLWATCEGAQAEKIDDGLREFVASKQETIVRLREANEALKEIEKRRLALSHELLTTWYKMTEDVFGSVKTASDNDLVFWNRLIKIAPEVYDFLQPQWENMERLCVSSQLREQQANERAQKVAKLLSSSAGAEPATSSQKGESHEKKPKNEEPGTR